jgi:hypothetical protein
MTGLTEHEHLVIARARQLAGVLGAEAVRTYTGTDNTDLAYAEALGEAQHLLGELAAIADRPDSADEDTRRLGAIRDLLAHFDWEHHDRQLALEAIERIVDVGQP